MIAGVILGTYANWGLKDTERRLREYVDLGDAAVKTEFIGHARQILDVANEVKAHVDNLDAENIRRVEWVLRWISQQDKEKRDRHMMGKVSIESDEDVELLISEYQDPANRTFLETVYKRFRADNEDVLDAWRHTLEAHLHFMLEGTDSAKPE